MGAEGCRQGRLSLQHALLLHAVCLTQASPGGAEHWGACWSQLPSHTHSLRGNKRCPCVVPPWHPGHLRPAQALCSQLPEHLPLCCQSVGLKQQRWRTCMHPLAGCIHPCPQACRPGPPHQHHHRPCWPALQLASQQQLEVPSSCHQRWGPRLWKLLSRHCHSQCWPANQPGSPHRTLWFPPVTSAGPLGDCDNCPGSRWFCRHWPWCTSAQGQGQHTFSRLWQEGYVYMQPWL